MAPSRACSRFILFPFLQVFLAAQVPTVLDIANPAEGHGHPGLSAGVSAFAFSDPVSLKAIGERWQGAFTPRAGNQGLFGNINTAVSYQRDQVEFRLWQQQRVLMSANRDTVEFLRTTKAREDLPTGRTYDLEMAVQGSSRSGVTLSRIWVLAESGEFTWMLGAGGKGWYADQAQNGFVLGKARASGVKTYDFNLSVDYRYTRNILYDLPVPPSSGIGFGGVIGTSLHLAEWSLAVAVDDLCSTTWWKALPYTYAEAKSQRQHYDLNGYLQFDPTIEGIEGRGNWIQKSPTAWMVRASWGVGAWRLGSRVERISNFTFQAMEASYLWDSVDRLELSYEPRTRSWGLAWAGKQARLGLALQSLNMSTTRSVGLSLGWAWGRP